VRDTPETALTVTGTRAADLKGQWSWALFQWARDFGGSIIIVFIFAPYFTTSVIGDPIKGQELWGHLNAMAGVFTGLTGPVLGAIADTTGRRKPWLVLFVAVMTATSALLWWCMPGGAGLGVGLSAAILVLYTIAYNYSDIFQSSMLATIAPVQRIGFLSGLGVALAQASTLLGLSILLYAFMLPGEVGWSFIPQHPLFGIDPSQFENSRISGPFSAIWLLVFSLPLFLFTPDGARISGGRAFGAVVAGMRQLRDTARELKHYRNVAVFLAARVCFNDAQVAIMIFSSIYAAGIFKWDALTLTCYALLLSLVSIGGALLGGWLCDRFGAKLAIIAGISAAAIGLTLAISITPDSMFFFIRFARIPTTGLPVFRTVPELVYMAISVATSTCVIAVFGTSRTMMARLAPVEKMSQFFGLYALSGSITAFLGPELVASVTGLFRSQRAGMASLLLLLGLGLAGICFVREERAVTARERPVP
jgi:UMF1 family MFS transporter